MNRLNNISFVIPVRIDSPERKWNLDLLLDFIMIHFDSKVYVVEADSEQKYKLSKKSSNKICYHFIEDTNPVFHHTKYLNFLYQLVDTPIIAGWDVDAIVPPNQIITTVEQIEKGNAIMGLPYNGFMLYTLPSHVNLYQSTHNVDTLVSNIPYMRPMYGSLSVGGAFIVNTREYIRSGGDNEHFLGWGPEDFERVKRIEILYPDHPIYRSSGYLFHLYHPRNLNSWYADEDYEKNGKKEYLKICKMETEELRKYVETWTWLKKIKTISKS